MILFSLDFETTSLNVEETRVIEVGGILWSTGQNRVLEASSYLVKSDVSIADETVKLTGITNVAMNRFGYESKVALENVLEMMDQADAVIGQNIIQFDKRVLEHWAQREKLVIPAKLWIDTRSDLPGVESRHLQYMAADHGFLNLFPHSALADAQTVVKLVSMYDINKVVERAQSPTIVILGHQKREDNALAKARKFRWSTEYGGIWWKAIKKLDLDEEVAAAKFNVSIAPPEISLSKLWYGN